MFIYLLVFIVVVSFLFHSLFWQCFSTCINYAGWSRM